ncbi:MAG: class I SAM-dependent methyltransferase [Candidatus Acidiferrum sp.]
MYAIERSLRFVRAALVAYGPSFAKKWIWDREYTWGKWNFNDETADDCVYPYLERYARGGSILDLGCGSGNTSTELKASAYKSYLGVDISEACLEKARKRTQMAGRVGKNTFVRGDFLEFVPACHFDLILFRESMYHVPMGKIPATLRRYSRCLTKHGVFVIRLFTFDKGKTLNRPSAMLRLIESQFEVAERGEHRYRGGEQAAVVVLVIRPQPRPD